jgi:hypothetical protein
MTAWDYAEILKWAVYLTVWGSITYRMMTANKEKSNDR